MGLLKRITEGSILGSQKEPAKWAINRLESSSGQLSRGYAWNVTEKFKGNFDPRSWK